VNLKYKIVWIDDRPDDIEDEVNNVKAYIGEEGFVPEIQVIDDDSAGIDEILSDPQLDIIITDFHLSTMPARDVIAKSRLQHKYIEIILYTQRVGTDIKSTAQEFQGVFFDNRDGLVETIKKVIESSIRRSQDVKTMRGIVISEAIDIENQIKDVILTYFRREHDLVEKVFSLRALCDFGKKISFLNSMLKKVVKISQEKKDDTSLDPAIRGSYKLFWDEIQPIKSDCKQLCKEVMEPRNILAHVEHEINDQNKTFLKSLEKGYDEITVDTEWCKNTRKTLMKHSANLSKLSGLIIRWNDYRETNPA
jgi:CheY-like chemotaxis protein